MSRISKEIQCLQRLQDLTGQLEDILQFLKLEGLVDDNQLKTVKLAADHAKEVQQILKALKVGNKVQMLEIEWNVLPVENIRIMIVTDRNHKEFIFNGG